MNTGEPIHKLKHDTGAITLKDEYYSSDNKTVDTTHFQIYEKIDFEAYLGTKTHYLHLNTLRQVQTFTLELYSSVLSLELYSAVLFCLSCTIQYFDEFAWKSTFSRIYTLTRNRSKFLKTNGNVAWLYNCPKFLSPLPILNKRYKRTPILFEDEIHFVDIISRETFTGAEEKLCSEKHLNLFQLDVDVDSWAELTPQITKVIGLALFKSHIVIQQIAIIITASIQLSIYTNNRMVDVWNSITLNSIRKNFSKSSVSQYKHADYLFQLLQEKIIIILE